jgi:hypothetical protein
MGHGAWGILDFGFWILDWGIRDWELLPLLLCSRSPSALLLPRSPAPGAPLLPRLQQKLSHNIAAIGGIACLSDGMG